jgi:integrase
MTDSRIRFHKPAIAKLSCPAGAVKRFFWDETLPGFGICVRETGLKAWAVQYRTSDGRSRRESLGDIRAVTLEEARATARDRISRARRGEDPQADKLAARRALKVLKLVDDYLEDTTKQHKPRYQLEVERHLRRRAAPLHNMAAVSVTRSDVNQLIQAIAQQNGGIEANRVRASLSAMWTWSLRTGRIEGDNPVAYVPKPSKETPRERVLTDAELAVIWDCTGGDHDHDRIVRLLLLTGARREEVGAMEWGELLFSPDGVSALWTIPRERTKNGLAHEVPLGLLALAQLPAQREDNPKVFGRLSNGFSGWSRCKERLDQRIEAALHDNETRAAVFATGWTLHDLRRTFSTWCNENGVDSHVVEAMLNHVSGRARHGVAGIYNKATYRAQKSAALAAWEAHLSRLAAEDQAELPVG